MILMADGKPQPTTVMVRASWPDCELVTGYFFKFNTYQQKRLLAPKNKMDLVKKKGNRGRSKWHGIQSIEFKLANGGYNRVRKFIVSTNRSTKSEQCREATGVTERICLVRRRTSYQILRSRQSY
jgi:hypothetical protein